MKIGFIQEPTEAERLFQLASEENFVLRQSLNDAQHELLKTQQKLTIAKERLAELGTNMTEFEAETNERLDEDDAGITETYEYTSSVEQIALDNGDAITELYEMIGE